MKAFCILLACLALATSSQAATIIQLAQGTPDLSALVTAASAADLVSALNGTTPYTVFAPTNAAFTAALPAMGLTLQQVLADKATLMGLLSYHVVPGTALSTDLADGEVLPTLLPGATLTVVKNATGVFIKPTGGPAAQVTTADVKADNGVVHIISGVLVPAPKGATAPMGETTMGAAPMGEATMP